MTLRQAYEAILNKQLKKTINNKHFLFSFKTKYTQDYNYDWPFIFMNPTLSCPSLH